MHRRPVGASRGLRWGCLTLAAIVALLAVASDPADARSRRKRQSAKRVAAAEQYHPPYAAIVVDAKTGTVLHQSNPDSPRHPASLTKIMTLYLLFERLEAGRITLNTSLPVSERAAKQAPTKLGLKPGDSIKVEDAIKALVTKSANDAAVVVAEALAGSEADFARLMTQKARAIGMHKTVYRNASGLPDDDQITTARDQALLGIVIQERFPRYYRYFSTESFEFRGHALRNHNHLLGRVDGVDGIKTGYTRASGFNLVTSVHRDGRHIVAVVLGGRSGRQRDARMRELIATNIARAATKRSLVQVAEAPKSEAMAAADSKHSLVPNAPPAVVTAHGPESTASVPVAPHLGSNEPIQPIKVKTLSVKLIPPRQPRPSETPVQTVSTPAVPDSPATSPRSSASPSPALNAEMKKYDVAGAAAEGTSSAKMDVAVGPAAPSRHIGRRGWAIQVGAFEDEKEAKERLTSAQNKLRSLLDNADAYTERTTKGAKVYYRARFAGFGRDKAYAACKKLKASDIACMALKI